MKIKIWTDGGCRQYDSVGGCGIVVQVEEAFIYEDCFRLTHTTSNRAELWAAIEGIYTIIERLELFYHKIEILTDSQYMINGVCSLRDKHFIFNGKNKDLFKELHYLVSKYPLYFIKVKGHSGIEGNVRADKLVKLALCPSFTGVTKKDNKNVRT